MSLYCLSFGYPARWWSFTTNIRFLIESFCGHASANADFSARVGMAAHELLENAVKYSVAPDADIICDLEIQDDLLTISVKNASRQDHIETLLAEYDLISVRPPLDLYIERMQADAPHFQSRLGLARIRYEGEARLRLTVDGLNVTMEATFDVPRRQTSHEQHESQHLSN